MQHSLIRLNLNRSIWEATRNKNCIGFESNLKLKIAKAEAYVYPDIMVVCGDIRFAENTSDVITNPVLIIEVLSSSTETFDRGKWIKVFPESEILKAAKENADSMRNSDDESLQRDCVKI